VGLPLTDAPTGQAQAVDAWLEAALRPPDPAIARALAANAAAGLPPHDVSILQGGFLAVLVLATGARRVLEIGTLGGVSAILLARAVGPEGVVVTLEADPRHAAVARRNLLDAGVADRVRLLEGPARDTLADLIGAGEPVFDLVFIDADKPNNPAYLDAALALSRPGTLIIADNVVRDGAILDPASPDPRVQGVRTYLNRIGGHPRLTSSALQTVGAKGWDGFAISVVR
jgi:predicted O-methyltransferase YrrM